ncbi:phosphotriesterase family protein [Microvirga massiliensis]|uniref:phosphotriesterase family protein n=1 Tax=Microvirga massiliensis TaxID=1033741 RepID=UPI00062B5D21|nr:hypothetical protein [Microvirga massiliensis]
MTRAARAGEVSTVTGPIGPEALGITLMHEHLLCDVTPPDLAAHGHPRIEVTLENVHAVRYGWVRHYGNHILDDVSTAAEEAALFREAGGGTIVDVTVAGIRPDPRGLKRITELSGVTVVAGTGYYIESFASEAIGTRSVDELAATMIADIRDGFEDTGIRAGIIGEIGVSDPWSEAERRVMQAAVIAQQATGATITVHPGRDSESPLAVARFVRSAGGDTSRLVIGHLDRTLFETDEVLRLLDQGVVGEWDFFGIESSYYPFALIDLPNDGRRLELIRAALAAGFGEQIVISHDICTITRLSRWGGHGYGHIPRDVVAMMRRKSFSEPEIRRILVANPARLLTLA